VEKNPIVVDPSKNDQVDPEIEIPRSTEVSTQTVSEHESMLIEVRSVDTQFRLIKTCMLEARAQQSLLQKHCAELIKYVELMRMQEKERMSGTQERLRREAERAKELEEQRLLNKQVHDQLDLKNKMISSLQDQLKKSNETSVRIHEESKVLSDNLRDHIGRISTELGSVNREKKRLELEVSAYRSGLPPPTQSGLSRVLPKFGFATSRQDSMPNLLSSGSVQNNAITDPEDEHREIQEQLQKIIRDLSEKLVDKEEECERIKLLVPGGVPDVVKTEEPQPVVSDLPVLPRKSSVLELDNNSLSVETPALTSETASDESWMNDLMSNSSTPQPLPPTPQIPRPNPSRIRPLPNIAEAGPPKKELPPVPVTSQRPRAQSTNVGEEFKQNVLSGFANFKRLAEKGKEELVNKMKKDQGN